MSNVVIQQGDTFAILGTLTDDSGEIMPLAGRKVTIDFVRKGSIDLRLSTTGGGLSVEDGRLVCVVPSATTAALCGEYRIYAKIEQNGSQVSSFDYGILIVNPHKTGSTKWI